MLTFIQAIQQVGEQLGTTEFQLYEDNADDCRMNISSEARTIATIYNQDAIGVRALLEQQMTETFTELAS